MRSIGLIAVMLLAAVSGGCSDAKPEYGFEQQLALPGKHREVWAIAPTLNLSGVKEADPILQSDVVFNQLQQVAGLTVIPVNRVVEVFVALHIEQVQSDGQAALVCDLLGCDALLIPTVNTYDPYNPPKLGAALTLLRKGSFHRPTGVDPRELARRMAPPPASDTPRNSKMLQTVGIFDASNGSTRAELMRYVHGRNDPQSAYREDLYLVEMDRYAGFCYHSLIEELLDKLARGE